MEAIEALEQIHFNAPYWVFLLPLIGAGGDIVTGWIQASINGTWDSTKMRRGLYRKLLELLAVLIAWVVGLAISLPVDIAALVAAYVIIMEGFSILENLDQAGVNIPFAKRILKKAKNMVDPEEEEKKKDA
jgi:toxin secretion/phage lysis holin